MKNSKRPGLITLISLGLFLGAILPSLAVAQDNYVAGIWSLVAQGISEGCTEHTPCQTNPPYLCGTTICGSFQMGDPDIHVSQSGTTLSASEADVNGNPFTLSGAVSGNMVSFTIAGVGITPGVGPATTTYTGILNGNIIGGEFSGSASWSYQDANGNLITETATWIGAFAVTIQKCDFSQKTGIERCFGAQGSGCQGSPRPFFKNENTCLVEAYMSAGSTFHDRCCMRTNNTGFWCANGRTLECYDEFLLAIWDFACGRFWFHTFGPYPVGNTGDDISQNFIGWAPPGTHVDPINEDFCSSGKCRRDSKGKPIINRDPCGKFCECAEE